MKSWLIWATASVFALPACSSDESSTGAPDAGSSYLALPGATAVISGAVYDPEVFFFSSRTFSLPPEAGPDAYPPPALFEGPYLAQSAVPGARVDLESQGAPVASSEPTTPGGQYQIGGVPVSESEEYLLAVSPPEGEVQLGADLPPPTFTPVPPARYFPAKTLRTVVPASTYCYFQMVSAVGNAGALSSVAQVRSTSVPELLNRATTGGIILFWVYAPSPFLNYFVIPAEGVTAATNRGTLYAIDWAPPGRGPPGQSALGFIAAAGGVSPIGYYALVLPPGAPSPVTVTFSDPGPPPAPPGPPPGGPPAVPPGAEVEPPPEDPGRPWTIPPFTGTVSAGVSVQHIYAQPGAPPPGGSPGLEGAGPMPDFSWTCEAPPAP
ncbi:MAG TPA: hypothetical protein VEY30_03925 [Myxococcaceae bacterium]|nr:hypothetical protein [Myxococcaceae bacterium]